MKMLQNRNIVYFANDWNADHKTSSHHIAKELLKNNKIFYVETGGMRKPRKSVRDLKRIFCRLSLWFRGVRRVGDNFYIYSLIVLPFHHRLAIKLNKYLNLCFLRHAIKKYNFNEPIFWFVAPHVSYLADSFKRSLTVYYCTDNVSQMPDVDCKALEATENDLLNKADIVFATAEYLCERLRRKNINKDIIYSPHAVDFEHFSKTQGKNFPIAEEIKCIKKPVIGYVGLIEKWIDLDLIEYIAKSRPEWNLVIIGRVAVCVDAFKQLANVKFLGVRKYEDLPLYLKGFDVCLLPFKVDELTKSVNPIKIKEYLAAGKPVVSTWIPEMEKLRDFVKIADSYEDFVRKINCSLSDDNSDTIRKRTEFVMADSWQNRVVKISEAIENTIT